MLIESNPIKLIVSKKIFKDKHSNIKNEIVITNNNYVNQDNIFMNNSSSILKPEMEVVKNNTDIEIKEEINE